MKKIIHADLDHFSPKDGRIGIANMALNHVAEMVGTTPFYAYDKAMMRQRVGALRDALPDRLKIHYAIKANPMPAVVYHLAGLVDGLDVASHGELLTALNSPMLAANISVAGPGKNDVTLKAAIASGVLINVESVNELRRVAALGEQLKLAPRVALRLNPSFELKSSGMKMGGGAKAFGIDTAYLPDVFALLTQLTLQFEGFHIFLGSQNLNAEAIMEGHNNLFSLLHELVQDCPLETRTLNIGGGFGIPYFPGDQTLDLSLIGNNLGRLLAAYPSLSCQQIMLELGRYLVGEAGIYVCQVVDKKVSHGEIFLITDGGLHHHLANSGNFGQVIRKNYPVRIHQQQPNAALETVNIAGLLCTPLDILAQKMTLPKAEIGDYVVILQSGAYGKTASPEGFLSHPAVPEIVL